MSQYRARISDKEAIMRTYELRSWAGEEVMILPETLIYIPQLDKKRVDFLPLTASAEEIKEPLSIITDFLTPLTPACEDVL